MTNEDRPKIYQADIGNVEYWNEHRSEIVAAINAGEVLPGRNPEPTDAPTFRTSEIGDPIFWQQNKKEIVKAMRDGRIIKDTPQKGENNESEN